MNRTNEIELLKNPAYHTMEYNGYIRHWVIINENTILFNFNKEYFN